MKLRNACIAICLVLLLAAVGVSCTASPATAPTPAPQTKLQIEPVSVEQGEKMMIYGVGFTPYAEVLVLVRSTVGKYEINVTLSPPILRAGQDGAFSFEAQVHKNTVPSLYAVNAMDAEGVTAVSPLEVREKAK